MENSLNMQLLMSQLAERTRRDKVDDPDQIRNDLSKMLHDAESAALSLERVTRCISR